MKNNGGPRNHIYDYRDPKWQQIIQADDQGYCTKGSKFEYVGEKSKTGEPHGLGTMTYSNGEAYEGYFKDGKRHGQGT